MISFRRDHRVVTLMLFSTVITIALLVFALQARFSVVDISSAKISIPINEGDDVVHSYTHSMYKASVNEQFIIDDSRFHLMNVNTDSIAVLEYFGLNNKDVSHLNLFFDSFTIPSSSVGAHRLKIKGAEIDLGTGEERDGKVYIRIRKTGLIEYLKILIWG